jgi:hypothetical protein
VALERWGAHVTDIITGKKSNIVPMPKAASA